MAEETAHTAFWGLGANLGDPVRTLGKAKAALAEHEGVELLQASSLYWTEPVGGPAGQPPYLNAVLQVETTLLPENLLRLALAIEADFGRVRDQRWGPRTLDIDLLAYDALERSDADLTLPHAEMHRRGFVLVPLTEIAPDWRHPVLGKTARELLAALPDSGGIRLASEEW